MNEEGNKFNSKTDFSFGGEPYTVYFTTPDTDNLMLTIEHRISCDRWCGRYSSQQYDCVKYPLPLAYEEPNVEILKNMIQSLRTENEQLRKPSKDIDKIAREKKEIEESYRKLQVESANEVKHVRKQYDEIARELQSQTIENERLKKQVLHSNNTRNAEFEEKILQLKKELKQAKAEIDILKVENNRYYSSKPSSDGRSSPVIKSSRARSPSPKVSSSPRIERSRSPSPGRKVLTNSVEKRTSNRSSTEKHRIDKKGYESPKSTKLSLPKPPTSSNNRGSRSISPSLRSKTPTSTKEIPERKPSRGRVSSSPSRARQMPESPRRLSSSKLEDKKRGKPIKKTYYDTSEDESELASNTDMYSSHASAYISDDYSDYSYTSEDRRSYTRSSSRGKQPTSGKSKSKR
ncbi:predicted protein [Naegleria gruberi]|uniref:Predicted protein n=1 Tax=Naegleria gruberi TaxID=5762 RepID=D2VY96_NAEGR|nr:uncharacterized protein NAEGRDRAFT_74040 [Naegleria gruberi]EFC38162.1 predicted protein [Naegleria gruberi]|eukprot:XP_002670906.1 predicted protein [Naegleria gruberi strain NEG-M]